MAAIFLLVLVIVTLAQALASTSVTVTAHYPRKLPSLSLRGSGCGLDWDKGVAMKMTEQTGHYRWSYTVQCDDASTLELKVLINDETWMIGANHYVQVSKSGSSQATDVYPWFYTYEGSLRTINRVYSAELKNYRDVIIYTPPSYEENTLKVHSNVLIMHDGQNLFNPQTSAFGTAWMCQDTVDQLIATAASDEVILVGAYNTADRMDEYTYIYDPSEKAGGKGDLYLDWIESTLIPLIKSNLRVDLHRDQLGILGSSLGGLISCYAGWTRPEVYGRVGCMSSSFWWDSNDFQNSVLPAHSWNNTVPYSRPIFYMDAGTEPGGEASCAVDTKNVVSYLETEDGFTENQDVFIFIDQGGSHNEASWGARFDHPIKALYPANRA